ncbi:MAG: cob(I)yrinic acid a,c-diamide adenosyltransferase [Nitrococcus mobilis]|nr:cob(I)yrinic acid a,c-diamide adenosyltransferase [Nitrococcus mobilis]
MVKLTKIYTRTGDRGETALGNGERVAKHQPRVVAYGSVDETNAVIGVARLYVAGELEASLLRIQNDLFDVGADLSTPEAKPPKRQALRVRAGQVAWLENEIDRLNASLETLRSFVLPGGTVASAHLHHARTVARRAERDVVALMDEETINPVVLRYLNRLSDFLFVAGRAVNAVADGDVLWVPGKYRDDAG